MDKKRRQLDSNRKRTITMGTEAIFKDEFTLRDQIAIAAMQGLLASDKVFFTDDEITERAYRTADAMLKKREQS